MIFHLAPTIVRKIWGGRNLQNLKSIASLADDLEPIGETWEVSTDPETNNPLSYLAKFIDTSEELSIQVHPDNEYARLHENSSGKTECWIILKADKNAGIYLGLKPGTTESLLRSWLKEKRPIDQLLNFYPVSTGDYFYVPAGSIHAIGKNVMLAEVQQNSGITYRVWDWNRDRELHVEKSLDVINFEPEKNNKSYFKFQTNIFSKMGRTALVRHNDFKVDLVNLKKNEAILLNDLCDFSILNFLGSISTNKKTLNPLDAVFIRDEKNLELNANQDSSFLIISK